MPFTMDGQWIPSTPKASDTSTKPTQPVKVRLVKRKQSILTVILNLNMSLKEKEELASSLKKSLGSGGAVKDDEVVIQGDKVDLVKKHLLTLGIKSS